MSVPKNSDYSFEFLIDELNKKFKSRESKIADLNEEIKKLKSGQKSDFMKYLEYMQKSEDLEKQLKQVSNHSREVIFELKGKIADLEGQKDKQDKQITDLKIRCSNFDKFVDDLYSANRNLNKKLSEKIKEIEELERKLKEKDIFNDRLVNDQIHQYEIIQNLRDTIIKLNDELSEYENEKPSVREIVMEEIRLKNEEDDLK